mgnify:CR=1 FL=1
MQKAMRSSDIRWIEERANDVAHEIGKQIRNDLVAYYGTEHFPAISLQGRYEAGLIAEMTSAFERGLQLGKMQK